MDVMSSHTQPPLGRLIKRLRLCFPGDGEWGQGRAPTWGGQGTDVMSSHTQPPLSRLIKGLRLCFPGVGEWGQGRAPSSGVQGWRRGRELWKRGNREGGREKGYILWGTSLPKTCSSPSV